MSRRLPIYLLVDTTTGPAVKRAERAIEILLKELRIYPQALETGHLSIITFSGEARQVGPLAELMKFQFAPDQLASSSALRSGLTVLKDCLQREVRKATESAKGDWKGLVVIFSGEQLTEDLRAMADPDKQVSFLCIDCGSDFDFEALRGQLHSIFSSLWHFPGTSITPDSLQITPSLPPGLPPPSPEIITVPGNDTDQAETPYLPRVPIYFLVHTSDSMSGQPLEDANRAIQTSIGDMRTDPQLLEINHVSVIVFGDGAKQIRPLTSLSELQVPQFPLSYRKNKKSVWSVLRQSIQRDVRKTTEETRGDWKPVVFLFTNGHLSDEFVAEAQTTLQTTYLDWICVVGCGPDPNIEVTQRIRGGSGVVEASSLRINDFFRITS